jgi:hypothetical protein
MDNQLSTHVKQQSSPHLSAIEKVMITGDLSALTQEQRVVYYNRTCESLGLNPLTRPFDYIILNGKMQLYARKDCTEQLRKIHGISFTKIETKLQEGLYIVIAYATNKEGRTDVGTGAVSLSNLKGEALANAIMKAETKAKRRVTLSIAGLGWLDETEVDSIPNAQRVEKEVVEAVTERLGEVATTPVAKSTAADPVTTTPVVALSPLEQQQLSREVDLLNVATDVDTLKKELALLWAKYKGNAAIRKDIKERYEDRKAELLKQGGVH